MNSYIQILVLFFLTNYVVLIFFLDPGTKSKAIILGVLCFSFYCFKRNDFFKLTYITFSGIFLVCLFILRGIESTYTFFNHFDILILSSLMFWSLILSRFLSAPDCQALFKNIICFVGILTFVAALLGMYEYFSFVFLGKSSGMLVPHILPENKSIRIAGIYGQSNLFALFLLSGLLSFFYTYLHNPLFSISQCRIKFLYYLPLFVVALCFFLTGSRAGLLALLCTLLFMCLMVVRKRYLAHQPDFVRKFMMILGAVAIAGLCSYLLNFTFTGAGSRAVISSGVSIEARFVFWAAAWLIFLDHPWFGIGLGNYKFYLSEYLPKAHEWLGFVQFEAMGYTKWAHNEFLQLVCEGGVFVLLLLLFLLGSFSYQLFRFAKGKCDWSPLKFYSHILIIPFIIQSMFSWPMRHPGLLVLFVTFLAMLAAQYPGKVIVVPKWGQYSLKGVAFIGLTAVAFVAVQETKMGLFARAMTPENARDGFERFEELVAEPYTEYPLLLHLTPRYVGVALKYEDSEFGAKILPYVEKLTSMQGAHWQWYNLAAIYNLLGQRDRAHDAIESAIKVRPSEERYWSFQHYLNIQDASEKTGRPIEDFLPIPPDGEAKDLKDMFDFGGRDVIEM